MEKNDAFVFYIKAQMMSNAVDAFSLDVPPKRELRVQIDKLRRMASQYYKKLPSPLAVPAAKLRKLEGEQKHRLSQQAKLVDRLFSKMIEEVHRKVFPKAPYAKRKEFAGLSREFTIRFNKLIYQGAEKLSAETAKALEGVADVPRLKKFGA